MSFLMLDAEEYDRKYSDRDLFRWLIRYFIPYKAKIITAAIFVFISTVTSGIIPYLTSRIIRILEIQGNPQIIFLVLGCILILNALSYVFNYINLRAMAYSFNPVIYDIRKAAFEYVIHQDLAFYDKFSTGKIVSRINSDSDAFREMISVLAQSLGSLLFIFVSCIPMLFIDARLTGIFFILVPLFFIFTFSFRKVARKKTLQGQRALASVNAFVEESVLGIQIAKTFRQEERLAEDFYKVNKTSYNVNLQRALVLNILFPGMGLLQMIILTLLLTVGGQFVVDHAILTADLYLFIQSLFNLFFPIFTLAMFWPQFQVGLAAAERICALMDTKSNVVQRNNTNIPAIRGKITFEHLDFHYVPEKPIFKDFTLTIQPGESIALVGHTGAGKSSLIKILMRFYEFQGGEIYVDDMNIRDIDLQSFRTQIGFIPQTPFLWADTLLNNLIYGYPDALKEQVWKILEQIGAKEWVEALPNGLDTNIQERGKLLSMGQRQLVVLARVLLQNPAILIMDEATASVDPFTETQIQQAIDTVMHGRTSILIAHRLRTVRHVNRIITLDQGRIIEMGSHETLLAQKGYYARLYNMYFKHQSYEFLEEIRMKTR